VELVPYNLVQYSEDFTNAFWNPNSLTVISNDTTAPNGTMTADKLTDTASGAYIISNPITTNTGAIVTFSQYLKRSNNDWFYLGIARSSSTTYGEVVSFFNLATGAIGSSTGYGAGVFVNSTIENVGNGWYRCTMTAYVPNATAYVSYSGNANANGVPFVSDIGDARFQWGAQLNEGSTAKDYQKTETRLNIPRLDYSNGTCPSLLVEPQRTNIALYSEQTNNAFWNALNCTITANNITSPSGVTNADSVVTTSNNSFFGSAVSISANGSTYTQSIFAKWVSGYELFKFRSALTGGSSVAKESIFNLRTGVYISGDTTYQIEDFGNGWFRFSHQITNNNTNTNFNFQVFPTNDSTQTQSASFWGAQTEAGNYSTSYIPTTSASVTRNADVISKTGISSLIGQTEGTIFFEIDAPNPNANGGVTMIQVGTGSSRIYIAKESSTQNIFQLATQTALGYNFINTANITTSTIKFAIAYKNGDNAFYVNGSLISTASATANPTSLSQLNFGDTTFGNTDTQVKATALWKTRLTNTQLATLTTI
jgi:hypothetical protein